MLLLLLLFLKILTTRRKCSRGGGGGGGGGSVRGNVGEGDTHLLAVAVVAIVAPAQADHAEDGVALQTAAPAVARLVTVAADHRRLVRLSRPLPRLIC